MKKNWYFLRLIWWYQVEALFGSSPPTVPKFSRDWYRRLISEYSTLGDSLPVRVWTKKNTWFMSLSKELVYVLF